MNKTVIDPAFSDNAFRMQEIIDFLRAIRQDSTINIVEISFCGAASPEGSYQLNRRLAQGRLEALERLIRKEVDIPDSLITYNDSYISWDYLKVQIQASSKLAHKEKVIAILDEEARLVDYHHPNTHIDNRIVKLKALDDGKVWQQMNQLFFNRMRNACAVFVTYKKELPPVPEPVIVPDTVVTEPVVEVVESAPEPTVVEEPAVPEVEEWSRKLHLKTNALGLGMGIANVTAETDLAKHWSFTLPVYYSTWDYIKSTVKFRTFAVQPELRYWLSEKMRTTSDYTQEFVFTKDISEGYDHEVTLDLLPGNYKVMVWSDLAQTSGDSHFHNADNFAEIRLQGDHKGNNNYRDAFRGSNNISFVSDVVEYLPDMLDITMQRPLAKFEFVTNDVVDII